MKTNEYTRATRTTITCLAAAVGLWLTHWATGQNTAAPDPSTVNDIKTPADARLHKLESLRVAIEKDRGVPLPDNLAEFVRDRDAAVQLGKALFWDMQVGSDGVQSCATCHYHAGVDPRTKNQLNPDILRVRRERHGPVKGYSGAANVPDLQFERGGPNFRLTADDFPFVRTTNMWEELPDGTVGPWRGDETFPANTNDVVSDQGVFLTLFEAVVPGEKVDLGSAQLDPVWNVKKVTARRVEPRNAPTVINAIFNFANFWDGRANPYFNGVTPFGDQDLEARIFMSQGKAASLISRKLRLRNASLASQAVGPPLSFFEMSHGNGGDNFRIFPELGRKLLSLNPLALQKVSPTDSVLGRLASPSGPGLDPNKFREGGSGPLINGYRYLISKAFRPEYWNSPELVVLPDPTQTEAPGNQAVVQDGPAFVAAPGTTRSVSFSHMEANMAFFFGVSVMMYEATLVSDRSPFDRWMEGDGTFIAGFRERELAGMNVFAHQGKCVNCHGGPEFTNASVRNAQNGRNAIEPMLMAKGEALYDNGFYNISVTLTTDDVGRGGSDPFGRPLAFSRQSLFQRLGIQQMPFSIIGDPFPAHDELETVFAGIDANGNDLIDVGEELSIKRVAVDGAFKVPTLRNVELTGPYFHNGGMATLRQVVQFYDRGGNFRKFNIRDLDPDIQRLGLEAEDERNLVRFLVSLTDRRVKIGAAPFDHPELFIPNGHPGDHNEITKTKLVNGVPQGSDDFIRLPAVGRDGDPDNPLGTFLGLDPQFGPNVVKQGKPPTDEELLQDEPESVLTSTQ